MQEFVLSIAGVITGVALLLVVIGLAFFLMRSRQTKARISVHGGGIESLRAIGELSVYKALTKEIVTEIDHSWGEFGKKYLDWAYSSRKMAMIFQFEIDFRYDLKRNDFLIQGDSGGAYTLQMPPCFYEINIKSIEFYDEQRSKLLPFLLPDLLNSFLGSGFTEEDKNRLFASAKAHAEDRAKSLIGNISSEVEKSAKTTLQAIGKAFGAATVAVEFQNADSMRMVLSTSERK